MTISPTNPVDPYQYGYERWLFLLGSDPALKMTYDTYLMEFDPRRRDLVHYNATCLAVVAALFSLDDLSAWFTRFRNNTPAECYTESVGAFYTRVVEAALEVMPSFSVEVRSVNDHVVPVSFRFSEPTITLRQRLRRALGGLYPD